MSEEIRIKSVAKGVATLEPIVLREEKTIRLIFNPIVVDEGKGSNVKGYILYQKKGLKDYWEDFREIEIKNIKKGEFVKLELDSSSITKLLNAIPLIQEVYDKYGIQFGNKKYYLSDENVDEIIEQISKFGDKNLLIDAIGKLDMNHIGSIGNLINISGLRNIISLWKENMTNSNEDYWQSFFTENVWILSQIFSAPFVFLQDKPYLGGKKIVNKGGVNGDFIYRNSITGNIAFIEIKTPAFKIIKSSYGRNGGVYTFNDELTGAINQVLTQKNTFLKELGNSKGSPDSYGSKCILVVGTISNLTSDEMNSFELFRNNLKDVEILTFDELFSKINSLLEILQENTSNNIDDEIPF